MYDTSHISEKIKNLAKVENISIKLMLEICQINKGFIYDLEKKKTFPSSDKLARVSDHFNVSVDYLLGRCDNPNQFYKPKQKETEAVTPIYTMLKPLFDTPASAGTGSYIDSDVQRRYINIKKTDTSMRADFMIEVRGDSMTPKFNDGDLLLIKETNSIDDGDIGLFVLNSEAYIKKIEKNQLISLNKKYSPIKLSEYDYCKCQGLVLGVAKTV